MSWPLMGWLSHTKGSGRLTTRPGIEWSATFGSASTPQASYRRIAAREKLQMEKRKATTADVVAYMTALHQHNREAARVAIANVDQRSFVMKLESFMFMLLDFVAEQADKSVEWLLEQAGQFHAEQED